MNVNITYDASVTSQSTAFQAQFMGAVNAAVGFLDHAFTNTISVNVTFAWNSLSGSAAAENSFYYNTYSYATVVNALKATGHSADDAAAYATLPATDPTGSGHSFALTASQAKALGLGFSAPYDDFVTLNSSLAWTFDPNNRAMAGDYDAIGALEHEATEGLLGRIGSLGSASVGIAANVFTPLDLFRYSSAGQRDFSANKADFFSVDGTQLLTEFNINSQFGGDVSDWYPTIRGDSFGDVYQNTVSAVTPTDLRELDVLGWTRAAAPVGDLNGDFVSDILWRNNSTGDTGYSGLNGGNTTWNEVGSSSAAYSVAGEGDFDANYAQDILFHNATTGDTGYWSTNGGASAWHDLGMEPTAYNVAGVGDFNADGNSDILWQNGSTGDVGYWAIINNIAAWHDIGAAPSAYAIAGVGDFDGDGTSDVLYRNPTSGDTTFYDTDTSLFHDIGVASPTYDIVGVSDFNADGVSDILYRNASTGDTGYYTLSHAGQSAAWHGLGASSTAYIVASVGDYNGDGVSDILWRNNASGDTGYTAITNTGSTSWHDLGTSSTAYTVVG